MRTLRNGYLASVGLMQPRVDNTMRALEFARSMDEIVRLFNATHGASLVCGPGSTPAT